MIGFLSGNAVVDPVSGVRVMQFVTPTAAAMGILYGSFPTVATTVALAREKGILKRVQGTPLPLPVYLGGRIGGAVALALGSLMVMVAVGVVVYDVQIVWRSAPAAVVTALAATACFAALGLAVAALASSSAVAQAASIAAAVLLGFVSELFFVGQDQPAWLTRLASVFPLAHVVRALKGQFDPVATGSGWDGRALLVIGVWTVAGVVVSVLGLRLRSRGRRGGGRAAPAGRPARRARPLVVAGTDVGRPATARLLVDQVRWSTRAGLRDPGAVFLSMAMPIVVYALSVLFYGSDADFDGTPFGVVVAAGMITWGGAVTGFVNLPEAVLRARERGELTRLRGTPLPPALHLAGRALSAVGWSLLTGVLLVVVGVTLLDLTVSVGGLVPAATILVLGVLTMAAVGTALGSFLPLKPVADGIAAALSPAAEPVGWASLGVTAGWFVVGALVALRRFGGRRDLRRGGPGRPPLPASGPAG